MANWQLLAIGGLAIGLGYLFIRLRRHESYFPVSFADDFKSEEDLRRRWHYEGGWSIPERGELRVTQSHAGGMTRVGQQWTDYRLEFTAVLESEVIAWILRAQDLSNYYMIQLTPTEVRPHLRYADQWLRFPPQSHNIEIERNIPIQIRTDVRGKEIRVFVNGGEIYNSEKLFGTKFWDVNDEETGSTFRVVVPAFTTGRIGFRQAGNERARFSKVRITPI